MSSLVESEGISRRRKKPMRESENFSCPDCGSRVVRRSERKGFLQNFVYSAFGLYPWVCRECKYKFLLKSRKDEPVKQREYDQEARSA